MLFAPKSVVRRGKESLAGVRRRMGMEQVVGHQMGIAR